MVNTGPFCDECPHNFQVQTEPYESFRNYFVLAKHTDWYKNRDAITMFYSIY